MRGIDALHRKNRAAEEKSLLLQEMRTVTEHLHQQHALLCSAINDTEHPGEKAALMQRLEQVEMKRHHATAVFQHVPEIVPATHGYIIPENPCLPQALPMSGIQTAQFSDDGDSDDIIIIMNKKMMITATRTFCTYDEDVMVLARPPQRVFVSARYLHWLSS
ncbi:hypothetical protein GJAV_G00274730 [Gymnothorax javanicus]|nr:hypothetical protein GJAV_G00274730 [Gymnothorax javanicus]